MWTRHLLGDEVVARFRHDLVMHPLLSEFAFQRRWDERSDDEMRPKKDGEMDRTAPFEYLWRLE